MCLAVPGRILSIAERTAAAATAGSISAASSRRSVSPSCPRRSRRLRARPCRLCPRRDRRKRSRTAYSSYLREMGELLEAERAVRRDGLCMKFRDEYRDPAAAHALCRGHLAHRDAALDHHGGLRRPDPRHRQVRHRRAVAGRTHLVHGPGCPVCVTPVEYIDKAIEIAARPERDLLLVWRHAARAGQRGRSAAAQAERRRCAHRLFAAGCARARASRAGARGRLLRRRLRDHRAGQRHGGLPRQPRGRNFSMLVSHVLVPPAMRARCSARRPTASRAFSPPAMSAP